MDYNFKLNFVQEQYGADNARIKVEFDGVVIYDNLEITSSDENSPSLVEFIVSKENGTYPLSITYLNDEYVDTDNDRNVKWIMTKINNIPIKWSTMVYDGETHYADTTLPGMEGWWHFKLTYEATVTTQITLPPVSPS